MVEEDGEAVEARAEHGFEDEPRFTDEERRAIAAGHRRTAEGMRELAASKKRSPQTRAAWESLAETWEEGARAVERGEVWSPPRAERRRRKDRGERRARPCSPAS